LPYFGKKTVSQITSGMAQEYQVHRMSEPERDDQADQTDKDADGEEKAKPWKPPARNTIHNEIVTLSMVLKTAQRHGWLEYIPDLSDPYRRQSKVEHRTWFTPNEYKQLYKATRKNADNPKCKRFKWHAEQLHDFVLLMANTGLRRDEVKHLEFRDVEIVDDDATGERILEIEVRGKRGVGYCKCMLGCIPRIPHLLPCPLTPHCPDDLVI
jgi:integrase